MARCCKLKNVSLVKRVVSGARDCRQSSVGVNVSVPIGEFVEWTPKSVRGHSGNNPATLTTTTPQQFCVLNKAPYSELHAGSAADASRTWQLKPRKEAMRRSYVFEIAIEVRQTQFCSKNC